ncbi:LysR family transcriptional regulator [Desulfomarina sp.]
MDIRQLDLNLLKTLHVLLEEESVSRAASKLFLSQSAVSHALGRLRVFFNDPLLIKVRNGMVPTVKAEELKVPLNDILLQIKSLVDEENFDPSTEKITFRVAASDYGSGIILPSLAAKMLEEAPDCSLECGPITNHLEHDLHLGLLDIAFGGYKPFKNYSHEILFHDRYVGVVRSGHPITSEHPAKSDLVRWPHVYISASSESSDKDELYKLLGIGKTGNVITVKEPYFLVAPLLVEKSNLIIIMPEMGAKLMSRLVDVRRIELPVPEKSFPFIQVWHHRRDNDKMHQWFRKRVKEVCLQTDDYFVADYV